MRHLASVGGIEGDESVAAAAAAEAAVAYDIRLEVGLEEVLSAASRALVFVYCVVVVADKWSRAVPLFVAAAARF